MFGWLLFAAPLALIVAVGAAIWLEGHIVDQPVTSAPSPAGPSEALPPTSSAS
jgi:hypothetical protein